MLKIQRNLKKYAREEDKKNFHDLQWGVITLEESLERFKEANDIEEDISLEEYEAWLHTEGYLNGLSDIYE